MNRDALIIGIAVVAGFAAGAVGSWVGGSAALPQPEGSAQPQSARATSMNAGGTAEAARPMRFASVEELAARQAELEAELARMEAELDDLTLNLASRVQSSMRSQAEERASDFRNTFIGRRSERQKELLMESGFTEQQASTFIRRQEDVAMQRLYLRDQAAREGWLGTERYDEALEQLPSVNESIRSDLSDNDYDKYLYATRQRNRVMVTNVLQGSPAESAGVQPGDIVYAMDGRRVFETRDLLAISSQGSAGETVSLEVLRDGERVQVYVPRGPLGVSSIPQLADPATNEIRYGRGFRFGRGLRSRGTF